MKPHHRDEKSREKKRRKKQHASKQLTTNSKLWNKNPALLLLAGERSQSPLWEVKHFVLFSASLCLFRYIYIYIFLLFRWPLSLIDELVEHGKGSYLYPLSFFGMATGMRKKSLRLLLRPHESSCALFVMQNTKLHL